MSEISLNPKALSIEEFRLKAYRNRIQADHESELRNMEAQHAQTVEKTTDRQRQQLDQLKEAYDVKISKEAEDLENQLHRIQLEKSEKLEQEKLKADAEINRFRTAHQDQVRQIQKNSQNELETLQKKLGEATQALHQQVKKTSIRNKAYEKGDPS
ncbi:MAG: hypothetical protein ACO3A2_08685 [Bdellovibrionia bacterium]